LWTARTTRRIRHEKILFPALYVGNRI
jgi:hypothetical protein